MKRTFFIIIILIFILTLYAFYIEPNTLKVNEYKVTSNSLTSSYDGLKIVHFSDTLYTNKMRESNLNNLVSSINDKNPDVIIFTGDLINGKVNSKIEDKILNKLKTLNAKLYKYAVLGDHDNDTSREILENAGFIILDNSVQYLFYKDNNPIMIVGGDNLTGELSGIDDTITPLYKIALIHKPDLADDIINDGYNLILAGHSLGGQVKIPIYKPIINFDGAKKYNSPVHNYNNGVMYISYGLGTIKYNARLFDKPSYNIYRLYSK